MILAIIINNCSVREANSCGMKYEMQTLRPDTFWELKLDPQKRANANAPVTALRGVPYSQAHEKDPILTGRYFIATQALCVLCFRMGSTTQGGLVLSPCGNPCWRDARTREFAERSGLQNRTQLRTHAGAMSAWTPGSKWHH